MATNQDQGVPTIAKAGWLPRLFTAVLPRVRPFQEMGVSGTPVYAGYVLTPEKSPKLVGQEKYRTYSEMLANVSIVAAGVRYFLNVIAKPSWSAEAPEESGDEGQKYVDFVNEVLMEDLTTPWSRVIRRCGTYRFHGFNIQEWTAKKREDGKIGFADIESRPQWTIWRWEVDERGTVTGAWQRDPLTGRELGLPRGKLMYLVDDTLTDSPEGMGLLRHCYEPARRLEEYLKQEGFGYLRDLQGVPLGRAPINEMAGMVANKKMTQAQMDMSLKTLKDFVTLEKKDRNTGMVLDSQPFIDVSESGLSVSGQQKWGLELISGAASGLDKVGNAIIRLNTEMARVIGVEHLLLGADAEGSYALAKEKARDMYLLANSVLRDIREQVTHDLLWPLWNLNGFPDDMMPQLKTEDVQPKDVEQISRVLRDMASAGATLQPDDEIQNSIRDLLGMPQVDLEKIAEQMQQMASMQTQQPGGFGGAGAGAGAGGGNSFAGDFMGFEPGEPRPPRPRGAAVSRPAMARGPRLTTPVNKRANGHSDWDFDREDFDLSKAWEESKHPRGYHGRFGSGGGGDSSAGADGAAGGDSAQDDAEPASEQQRSRVQGVIDGAKKVWNDARPVLGQIAVMVGTMAISYAIGHFVTTGIQRSADRARARAQARSNYQHQWDEYQRNRERYRQDGGRGGGRATSTSHDEPGVAAARAQHGAKAAAIMALFLRGGTPGERAAAEAALRRMGIEPTKFSKVWKILLKAGKSPFDALDHLLTEKEAGLILNAVLHNLTSDQAEELIRRAKEFKQPTSDWIAKADWEETKHPRAEHGRFGPGGGGSKGGGAKAESDNADKPQSAEDHAAVSHSISTFLSDSVSTISSAVKGWAKENGLAFVASTAISVAMYKMFGRALTGMLTGPYGTAIIIGEEVAYTLAFQMVEALSNKVQEVHPDEVKSLLVETTHELLGKHKQSAVAVEKAAADHPDKVDGKAADEQGKEQQETADPSKIIQALKALLIGFKRVDTAKIWQQPQQDQQDSDEEGKDDKKVKKMVPYAQARPYRWEDDTFASRAGASDGYMDESVQGPAMYAQERRETARSQGPYGSMRGPDNQNDAPLNLGDDVVPGSRMRTKGRRRVL